MSVLALITQLVVLALAVAMVVMVAVVALRRRRLPPEQRRAERTDLRHEFLAGALVGFLLGSALCDLGGHGAVALGAFVLLAIYIRDCQRVYG